MKRGLNTLYHNAMKRGHNTRHKSVDYTGQLSYRNILLKAKLAAYFPFSDTDTNGSALNIKAEQSMG